MSKKRVAIIIVSVILSVIAVSMAIISTFVRAPEKPGTTRTDVSPNFEIQKKINTGDGKYKSKQFPYLLLYEGVSFSAEVPVLNDSDRREGVYTILIAGTSDGYSTDAIMVARIDTEDSRADFVSIPRDTKVSCTRALKKINGAYGSGGIKLLRKEVAGILGFTPDFYVVVDLKGFITLVDAIDGVDFDVPNRMNYDDPTQNLHIHFKKGMQHLDGQKAMEMLRFRGYIGSDLTRMEVQQEFLKTVAKKMMRPQTLLLMNDLSEIYMENVTTDMTAGNLVWLATKVYGMGMENIYTSTLPTYTVEEDNPNFYQFVSAKAAIAMINEQLNPNTTDITAANVNYVR